ncbi:hypothetical protein AAG570_002325 [Ranatra chinensis]|uniref:Uncharacterized protein n=1 Tax=Ranatra chinensis TaxID=642074 RepID=A0ABD0YQ03_9HEMI
MNIGGRDTTPRGDHEANVSSVGVVGIRDGLMEIGRIHVDWDDSRLETARWEKPPIGDTTSRGNQEAGREDAREVGRASSFVRKVLNFWCGTRPRPDPYLAAARSGSCPGSGVGGRARITRGKISRPPDLAPSPQRPSEITSGVSVIEKNRRLQSYVWKKPG